MTNYRYDYDKWENAHQVTAETVRKILSGEEKHTTPKHYSGLRIEPLEYIIANNLDFLEGNIVKYVTRYPNKGGVDDLIKAREYIDKLIERERA